MKRPFILYDSQIFDTQKFGGISRYFCEIIAQLQMDYKLAVLYTENHYLKHGRLMRHNIPLPGFLRKRFAGKLYRRNRKRALKLLRGKTPCLYHPTYYAPSLLRHVGDAPVVVTVHDMIYERFPKAFPDAEEVIRQKREIIARANRIIAISEYTKKDIVEILGIAPEKIDVVYHGTSLRPVRHRGLELPESYLLFVGDRSFYKNFTALLEAFAWIRRTHRDLHLVCTGKPFSENEQRQFSVFGINGFVRQMSVSDEELSELYGRALLFVYPSYYEGFGIPILEAYACGCPVALSDATCFPEIAGDAGAYFDPHSVPSMVEVLTELIDHADRRTRLIEAGRERLKRYSWEKSARQTEQVYRKAWQEDVLSASKQ